MHQVSCTSSTHQSIALVSALDGSDLIGFGRAYRAPALDTELGLGIV